MNLSSKQTVIIGTTIAVLLLIAVLVLFNLRPSETAGVQLVMWGFEKETVIKPIISAYRQSHPNVNVTYKEVSKNNYETTLLNALASGQGPDIFPVHNRSLIKNANVLYPAPPSQFNTSQLENLFPAEVAQDFVLTSGGNTQTRQVYALPTYFDTLSLIYNKELFDQAGIANPPSTWEQFQSDIPKLRIISVSGQITRAGAALGGSQKTVTNAVDILNAIMLQNGVAMTTGNYASFASEKGIGAFNFYLRFADSGSTYYTWNETQQKDVDNFSAGNIAMIFGYNSDLQSIKVKSPFLRIGIAPFPQINPSNAVNYADYWGLAVSKQSKNPADSWDFVIYASTQQQIAENYSNASGNPPALRTLISQKINDVAFGVFAKQALTARSWNQIDENRIDEIFDEAILNALGGKGDIRKVLFQAQDQVTRLMQGR
ncbi:MAG: extracellular solute-binding protein [Candidatus Liptonbacteria bacterium]|nr:extracellular solute-binding protein [Candidatus Liptonbacteria bacterium]